MNDSTRSKLIAGAAAVAMFAFVGMLSRCEEAHAEIAPIPPAPVQATDDELLATIASVERWTLRSAGGTTSRRWYYAERTCATCSSTGGPVWTERNPFLSDRDLMILVRKYHVGLVWFRGLDGTLTVVSNVESPNNPGTPVSDDGMVRTVARAIVSKLCEHVEIVRGKPDVLPW